MDHRTDGDIAHWQAVTWLDVGTWASLNEVALLEFVRRNDVTLLAVRVVQQCNTCGAVWIVFNVRNLGWHTIFV
ncbi:unannotated protein [freshwater metagenome]|uniref:Unannotated protein n=1 Tax=freshwater metagenome TaxID=449393 RepID=A0A6J6MT40_9ZZZZ